MWWYFWIDAMRYLLDYDFERDKTIFFKSFWECCWILFRNNLEFIVFICKLWKLIKLFDNLFLLSLISYLYCCYFCLIVSQQLIINANHLLILATLLTTSTLTLLSPSKMDLSLILSRTIHWQISQLTWDNLW